MVKQVLWTVLLAGMSAAAAGAAYRLAAQVWKGVTKEPPPERPGWANFLLGKRVKKATLHRMGAPGTV